MDLQLAGKVAVVTGGSRGIGRRIAQRFAEEGAKVAICGRGEDDVARAAEELRQVGTDVFGLAGDITDAGDAEAFVNGAADELGGLDILVNNVGGSGVRSLGESTDEDWLRVYEVNVFQVARAIRLSLPHFRQRGGGSVAIISSISGWLPAGHVIYGSAKAASIFMAKELALELAPLGVRVNTVAPGSTIWPGGGWNKFKESDPEAFAEFERRHFPMGRLGKPEEIADVVAFISSPRASWINGVIIPVDGAQRQAGRD